MTTVVFRSKVDTWLGAIVAVAALLALGSAVTELQSGEPARMAVAVAIALVGGVLPLWVLLVTRYTLSSTELEVVCGPFRWRVALREIRAVTPTRSSLSGPALSLDRLRIDYGRRRSIIISPLDKEGFIRELESRRAAAG